MRFWFVVEIASATVLLFNGLADGWRRKRAARRGGGLSKRDLGVDMLRKIIFALIIFLSISSLAGIATGAVPDKLIVQAWPEYSDDQVLFMETVAFPDSTPLPIEVKLAIPKGAQVTWAGELMADASQDIETTPKVNRFDDYDEVAFTLTKSRMGQVEAKWAGLKVEGENRALNFEWIQRYEAKETQIKFKVPTGSTDVKVTPQLSDISKSPDGMEVYSAPPVSLPVGQKLGYEVTYKRSTNVPAQSLAQSAQAQANIPAPAGGGSRNSSEYIAVALIALTAAVIAGAIIYQKNRTAE